MPKRNSPKQSTTPEFLTATKAHYHPSSKSYLPYFIIIAIAIAIPIGLFIRLQCQYLASQKQIIDTLKALSDRDSGDTYDEFVVNILADPPEVEVAAIFDQNGRKLIEYTGNELLVEIPEKAEVLLRQHFDHLTHVHTHPDYGALNHQAIYEPSSLSDNDLLMPYFTGIGNHFDTLAVISDDRVYSLDRNGRNWPTPDEIDTVFLSLLPTDLPPEEQFGSLVDTGYLYALTYHDEEQFECTAKFTEYVANMLGFKFHVDVSGTS